MFALDSFLFLAYNRLSTNNKDKDNKPDGEKQQFLKKGVWKITASRDDINAGGDSKHTY